MKFEVKTLKAISGSRLHITQEYVNNPIGVSIAVGTALQMLPGVNINDEGEFIQAPGFVDGDADRLRHAEKRIREFCNAAFESESPSIAYQAFAHDVLKMLDESI